MASVSEQDFEDNYLPIIENELVKRKAKWQLTSVPIICFDDVKEIIKHHIWKKLHLYDSNYDFRHWVNRIISNQIKNLQRNYYYVNERPCHSCIAKLPNDGCSVYGTQSCECPLYAKWFNSKKNARDIKLPLNLQSHAQEVYNKSKESVDLEKSAENLHNQMYKMLSPLEWKVYTFLYIEDYTEMETAKKLGYKVKDKNTAYRQVTSVKKIIVEKAKEILFSDEIEILE